MRGGVMQLKKFVAPLAAVAVVGTAVVAPGALFGTQTNHHFLGTTGGTAIQALGATVESDFTSQSGVDTTLTGVQNTNTLATAIVPGVATVSAVSTLAKTEDVAGGGSKMTVKAQVGGVNLLNGLITAQAITTTDIAQVDANNNTSGSVDTQILGLKVGSLNIPLTINKNFHVTIPGVVNVWANASFVFPGPAGSGTILTYGAGLFIGLLQQKGNFPAGTFIFVNPTYGAISTVTPVTGAVIGGTAYGSKVIVSGGGLFSVNSGPTAKISMPIDGTGGVVLKNTTATANLTDILFAGAITDTAQGVKSPSNVAYSEMTTKLLGLNLLGGVVTADALTGVARVEALPGGGTKATATTSLVNLKVLGQVININTAPNTVINIANIGTLTIRAQATAVSASGLQANALVKVLELKINVATHGLPVGALLQIGVASAYITLPAP
jgi:hypothetical protein